jgi:hypothetical protein
MIELMILELAVTKISKLCRRIQIALHNVYPDY